MVRKRKNGAATDDRPSEPRLETRRISDLKPFPDQPYVFDDLSLPKLQELAADMRDTGVKNWPDILPENAAGYEKDTIIDGHRRKGAMKLLNWSETTVNVRYDLANATRREIQREFVGPNIHRRQMTPLQTARAIVFEHQTTLRVPIGRLADTIDQDLLDRLERTLGGSARHLKRIRKILDAPLAVQRACDGGKLKMMLAERVAGMPTEDQAEIARRIDAGESPTTVVQAFFPTAQCSIDMAVDRYFAGIVQSEHKLSLRLDELDQLSRMGVVPGYVDEIEKCIQFLQTLRTALQTALKDRRQHLGA